MFRSSRIPHIALAFALALSPAAALAQEPAPALSLQHRMLVRCSAAFALVANAQENGSEDGARYPALSTSGREFFVRALAQVMDEAGLTREQVAAAASAEAEDMVSNGTLHQVMPACIGLLPQE